MKTSLDSWCYFILSHCVVLLVCSSYNIFCGTFWLKEKRQKVEGAKEKKKPHQKREKRRRKKSKKNKESEKNNLEVLACVLRCIIWLCSFLFLLVFFVAQAGISLLGEVNLVRGSVDNQRSCGAKIAGSSIFWSEAGSVCHSPPQR